MARGFDDMDRFFTVCPNEKKSDHLIRRNSLRFCGAVPKLTSTQEKSMRSGGVRRKENGSNILEEYQKRKYYRKMVQDCGGAYWSRSCALILSNHRSVELLRNYRNYIMVEKVTIDWTIADECFSTLQFNYRIFSKISRAYFKLSSHAYFRAMLNFKKAKIARRKSSVAYASKMY